MTWFDAMIVIVAASSGALVGAGCAWLLSALTYEHVRHDIDAWLRLIKERHESQLAHDAHERRLDRGHIVLLLSRINMLRNGNPDDDSGST